MKTGSHLSRRNFLKLTALSAGALGLGGSVEGQASAAGRISIVVDSSDSVTSAAPVAWAIQELGRSLAQHGIAAGYFDAVQQVTASDLCIVACGRRSRFASATLKTIKVSLPEGPEALALAPFTLHGRPALLACGSDARGLMYALLELADRIEHAENPVDALKMQAPVAEQPLNAVRSMGRPFVSDIEDKPWFNDRAMWPAYFSMLARQRFNRFHLAFGIGHDFLSNVIDAYLLFAYPFLLSVPGYKVRAVDLPDAERDQNLDTLQFISREAVAHGIDFHLGIWTHGYQWIDSPHANYTIEGLTSENHAAYSRDALAALLQACPQISGVVVRTHGESGVREGSYSFWNTVLQGVPQSGRKVQIDLHTKGLDQKLIEGALATGMPLQLSPKYWAEHIGMPYHQAAIRELELPREPAAANAGIKTDSFFSLSSGSRSFTRYGYADFLHQNPRFGVMYRVWPGTYRFLLSGDPEWAASNSRAFHFCGSSGAELMEPLSFKGRRGSGVAGGRCAYADSSLNPRWDWEKYLYTFRVWGRLLYNPDTGASTWRRYLRHQFQSDAPDVEAALSSASRILPIVTTAHMPSAANDTYSPAIYTNQSMMDPDKWQPYGDTPSPRVFGNTSPLDPQLFSRISDFAGELLQGGLSGKYSPVEVAQWIEDLAETAAGRLAAAERHKGASPSPDFRRIVIDVRIQVGLGRFFAAKLRSGTLYALHERSGDSKALEEALKAYRRAREIWFQFANEAKDIYANDVTFGPRRDERGHWLDRLGAIDADIVDMAKRLDSLAPGAASSASVSSAISQVLGRPQRISTTCHHTVPEPFFPGKPLELTLVVENSLAPLTGRLWYRHVNQAERYQVATMEQQGRGFRIAIPGAYITGNYPLQYYFELRQSAGAAWLYPGFVSDLANQPYFVVRPIA